MNCEDALDRLSARIDGELGAAEERELDAHLAGCPSCARQLARIEDVCSGLALLRDVAVPEGLADRIVATVPSPRRRLPMPRLHDARRAAGWAIVLSGLAWQLGGGALAARAMDRAAPVLADARVHVVRTQIRGEGFLARLRAEARPSQAPIPNHRTENAR